MLSYHQCKFANTFFFSDIFNILNIKIAFYIVKNVSRFLDYVRNSFKTQIG